MTCNTVNRRIIAEIQLGCRYTFLHKREVSFGNFTQPDSETDSYKYCNFDIVATEISNFAPTQAVSVFVKDGSDKNDGSLYLTQKNVETPASFSYDVYERTVTDENIADYTPMNESGDLGEYGYHLCTFTYAVQGATQNVTLAFNQNKLYGQDLDAIAGDYSGNLVFHSALISAGN